MKNREICARPCNRMPDSQTGRCLPYIRSPDTYMKSLMVYFCTKWAGGEDQTGIATFHTQIVSWRSFSNLCSHLFAHYNKRSGGESFCAVRLWKRWFLLFMWMKSHLRRDKMPELENQPCSTLVKSTKCVFSRRNKRVAASQPFSAAQQRLEERARCGWSLLLCFRSQVF